MENRRPLKTRQAGWAQALARGLGRSGLTPNAISTIGILFAAAGAWAFVQAESAPLLWLGGAVAIQLRLLANMLDGLVAVEGGKKSATGPLFNELPDRAEDALLLIGAGYGCGMAELGYGATILAFGTAYIRATGGALGFAQDFVGPMAKQHRMFVLTVGALGALAMGDGFAVEIALWIIAVGAAVTCAVRSLRIAGLLKDAGQ
ncbi:CDP-alcohol phosphatidyltransferase family protein [Alteraurantiacibacter aquimixticola]|uniref:CDP-alcohol phosphatidyltransferase family protein n=2 Tax=Alteraurantiacibacter aquimixticola TaxID=2489173 RepID=A0A4T3F3Q0_9SPHN|nr:CDP-alcohol phosphatidyltransferase family protein [Alteraurantiacibacter aquimixticola]